MQKRQEQVVLSYRKVIAFVDAHPELTPDTPEGRTFAARKVALAATVAAAEAAGSAQVTAAADRGVVSSNQPELKRRLRVHLKSIAEVARSLTAAVPGIGVLRLPQEHLRNLTLVARANAFAEQAQIYESVLVEHGLAGDFLPQLNAAIAAFHTCIIDRVAARAELATASSAVREHLAVGRAIVTGMNGVIHRAFDGRKDALAGWRAAKRVDRLPTRPQTSPLGTTSLLSAHSASNSGDAALRSDEPASTSVQSGVQHVQATLPVESTAVNTAQRAA